MKAKKILSLLTLVFLILFLIVTALPNDGTDPKPDPDADPWNETGSTPYYDDDGTVIIVTVSHVPASPYFTFTFVKVSVSDTPVKTRGSKSTTRSRHSRIKASR